MPTTRPDTVRDVATLLEALPYIREFHGKTVVIKYGGAAMEDPALREEFARDVVLLKYVGINPIVVHGGGPEITSYMERLGLPVQFVGGLRVSDADTVEDALDGIAGGMRPKLLACLNAIHGGVNHAHIVDGRVAHALLLELFTDAGLGTKIRAAI